MQTHHVPAHPATAELDSQPSLLDEAIERIESGKAAKKKAATSRKRASAKKKVTTALPDGYTLLEGGIERKIRVNRKWILYGHGKPIRVFEGNKAAVEYTDVIVQEQCSFQAERRANGCSLSRSVCLTTKSPLAVKP